MNLTPRTGITTNGPRIDLGSIRRILGSGTAGLLRCHGALWDSRPMQATCCTSSRLQQQRGQQEEERMPDQYSLMAGLWTWRVPSHSHSLA